MTPAVEFRNITKRFPGVLALDDVSWRLMPGEIHALLGENGAGKSTLLRILAADYRPDAGGLVLDGRPVAFNAPADAHAAGIRVIYQEPNLVLTRSVAENVLLGRLPRRWRRVDTSALHSATAALARRLGVTLDPRQMVGGLGAAQRQIVEIMKALAADTRVLALDEPTSSLSTREAEQLFTLLDRLRASGVGIIYVSHRMEEIRRLADRVTVLRDGRLVATAELSNVDDGGLIRMMVGRKLTDVFGTSTGVGQEIALRLRGLTTNRVGPVSLTVRRGEVVGLAGLVGSGRSRLVRALSGVDQVTAGVIEAHGRPIRLRSPTDAIDAGIGVCPEDRKALALVPDRSVGENIALTSRISRPRLRVIRRKAEAALIDRYMSELRIKAPSAATRVSTLSGGNQQKVVLARWLALEPSVLVLDEPTRGIDVGARSEIYALIRRLAASGVAILFASSELIEVIGLADRSYVMRAGTVTGEVSRADATEELLLQYAIGSTESLSGRKAE